MFTLFDISPEVPLGFSYYKNFITHAEENELIHIIRRLDLKNMQFHQYEARRKVISFGSGWSFSEQRLVTGNPIPAAFDFLITLIAENLAIDKKQIAQFLITEYPVGSVINWHRDAPPFAIIAGVSLSADCIFKLRPHDKSKQTRKAVINFPVSRRSLYTMQGASKTEWQHSTAPLENIRYSLTFRTLV